MKAICISACEIAGVGIVRAGEEVELADGFYNDQRVRTHFSIVESSVKDKTAKPPDMLALADRRRETFAQHLRDHKARIAALNKLVDFGADIPRELLDTDQEVAWSESERIAKIVELWCDNFGYDFPTDPQPKMKNEKKPAKKGSKKNQDDEPEGDRHDRGLNPVRGPDGRILYWKTIGPNGEELRTLSPGDKGPEGPAGDENAERLDGGEGADQPAQEAGGAQMDLLDKLNGKK